MIARHIVPWLCPPGFLWMPWGLATQAVPGTTIGGFKVRAGRRTPHAELEQVRRMLFGLVAEMARSGLTHFAQQRPPRVLVPAPMGLCQPARRRCQMNLASASRVGSPTPKGQVQHQLSGPSGVLGDAEDGAPVAAGEYPLGPRVHRAMTRARIAIRHPARWSPAAASQRARQGPIGERLETAEEPAPLVTMAVFNSRASCIPVPVASFGTLPSERGVVVTSSSCL